MNKLFTFLLIILSQFKCFSQSVGDWNWLNHLPQNSIYCIKNIPGTNNIIAAGDVGTIWLSDDAGQTWSVQYLHSFQYLQITDIFFIDSLYGYLTGGNGLVYKTIDGGLTWTEQHTGNLNFSLIAIEFCSRDTGYVCGVDGTLLKTVDGGLSWRKLNAQSTDHFRDICITSNRAIHILANHSTFYSDDGGNTWVHQSIPVTGDLNSVSFVNDSVGFIVGNLMVPWGQPSDDFLLKTIDHGLTWDSIHYYGWRADFRKTFFISPDTGFVLGWRGPIFRTTNGGINFTSTQGIGVNRMYSLDFSSPNFGLLGMENGVILSTLDFGLNWLPLTDTISYPTFSRCHFINDSTGFICCIPDRDYHHISIMHTYDQGNSWDTTYSSSSGNGSFISLSVVNDSTYYVLYKDQLLNQPYHLIKSSDNGLTWTSITNNLGSSIKEINFLTDSIGWACASYGKIYKTVDGGINWTLHPYTAGPTVSLISICAINDTIVFVAGINGSAVAPPLIIKSTDSGTTWTPTVLPGNRNISKIRFKSDSVGFAVTGPGGEGNIFKTTDQGSSWSLMATTVLGLSDIHFTSDSIGYCIGELGRILKTIDQGEHWFKQNSNSYYNLESMSFINDTVGFIVGGVHSLLYTNNGGGYDCPAAVFNSSTIYAYAGDTISFQFLYNFWLLNNDESTYFIDYGDGSTDTLYNSDHIYNTPGIYNVTFVVKFKDCTDSSSLTVYIDLPNKIENINIDSYGLIYPNPATNAFYFSSKHFQKPESILISNVFGETVRSLNSIDAETAIDISDLACGFYNVTISGVNFSYTNKLIIAR